MGQNTLIPPPPPNGRNRKPELLPREIGFWASLAAKVNHLLKGGQEGSVQELERWYDWEYYGEHDGQPKPPKPQKLDR